MQQIDYGNDKSPSESSLSRLLATKLAAFNMTKAGSHFRMAPIMLQQHASDETTVSIDETECVTVEGCLNSSAYYVSVFYLRTYLS